MSDDTFAAYDAKYAEVAALQAEILPLNKQALFAALAQAGIDTVTVLFEGSNDEGQIESVDAFDAENKPVGLPDTTIDFREVTFEGPTVTTDPRSVSEAVEIMSYELLEQTHDGWENDDGGRAEFTFNAAERTIHLDYNEHYIASTNYQHDF